MKRQAFRLGGWFLCSRLVVGLTTAHSYTHTCSGTTENFCTTTSMGDKAKVRQAQEEAVWGLSIADALAMPVHWYYNPSDIRHGYGGWIRDYQAPNRKHPSSILTLSAIDGSGRSGWHSKAEPVIGSVILHDKLKFWTSRDRSIHYHQGMAAGDNTLNALVAQQSLKVMQELDPDTSMDPQDLRAAVIENYVHFMTTPGSHGDTYAESFHRLFFREWRDQEPRPTKGQDILHFCENRYKEKARQGSEDSQLPQIGALVLAIPWIVHYSSRPAQECAQLTTDAISMTHPAPSLMAYVELYAKLLWATIHGADLQQEVMATLGQPALGGSRKQALAQKLIAEGERYAASSEGRLEHSQDVTSSLGSACYIDGALSTMLFLAHQFHANFEEGVLTNANCGGENAHRGAALGALLGAASVYRGQPIAAKWKEGLKSKQAIRQILK